MPKYFNLFNLKLFIYYTVIYSEVCLKNSSFFLLILVTLSPGMTFLCFNKNVQTSVKEISSLGGGSASALPKQSHFWSSPSIS